MDILFRGAKNLGIDLSAEQMELFRSYYQEMTEWNSRMNLTTIVENEKVQVFHFLDSLTCVLASEKGNFPFEGNASILDVGTGAGLPGIPLKIAFPDLHLFLLDSTGKKISFLGHLTEKLDLRFVEVIHGRAEELGRRPEYREKFDIVVSRAVAPLPTLVELCLPFCLPGGKFIALKKGGLDTEIALAQRAITALGGAPPGKIKVNLPELKDNRYVIVIEKLGQTPPNYPRRSGIPVRRPISNRA
ncbi:MAG: 16S rRNA (guanine(527)-N(7))-methyltransferase RsmG [Dehalococcoidia bacterium]|nr:16S rRNA (guanine(527)-N(7))-methyltransferase RsmG [Dehalococcoidia bacterium]MDZ4246843.1 16S rRNA (guanine(527)-N(7))-methyltransferase RsmG [Dehalococcoidia bacterium]